MWLHFGLAQKRLYGYDQIGNRLESTEGTASASTYGANDVNAYDWVQPPSPDPQEYFCYDEDGNLLRDGKATSNCAGTDGLREYKCILGTVTYYWRWFFTAADAEGRGGGDRITGLRQATGERM